jgi:hypothetical protein
MKIIASGFSFLLFLGFIAAAALSLFDITPTNNSYIYGRDTDIFSTKINELNLNVSTAYLHIRVQDPTSTWSNISMSARCYNTSLSDWNCNATVTDLGALAADGNFLIYYFDAYDNNGVYGSNGTADGPNRARIDRRGPSIIFTNPANQSYANSNNVTIKISIVDEFSGVNASTANYSFDNSSWLPTSRSANIFSSSQLWDTTTYSNNQTVALYAKAVDILGNVNYTYINATIDNEVPRLVVSSPTANQTLYDTVSLVFTAEDSYSGPDKTTAAFTLGGTNGIFVCTGTNYSLNCSTNLNTKSFNDGPYNLTYSIRDRAGNLAQNTTPIIIDNQPPVISITNPVNNAEVKGIVTVNVSVTDSGIGVSNVSFRWENSSSLGNWSMLTCSGSIRSVSCSGTWNSSNYTDGIYSIRFKAYDSISRQTIGGVTVKVNNLITSTSTTSPTPSGPTTTSPAPSGSATTIITETTTTTPKNPVAEIISRWVSPENINKFLSTPSTSRNLSLVAIVSIVVAIILVFFFWPKKTSVYPGYKPKESIF